MRVVAELRGHDKVREDIKTCGVLKFLRSLNLVPFSYLDICLRIMTCPFLSPIPEIRGKECGKIQPTRTPLWI